MNIFWSATFGLVYFGFAEVETGAVAVDMNHLEGESGNVSHSHQKCERVKQRNAFGGIRRRYRNPHDFPIFTR
jgi:hypothetical protein